MKIIFTGGHHNSALEVARKILELKPETRILWLGHKYTMLGDKSISSEYKEVTNYNIDFKDLKAGKLYKTLNFIHWVRLPYGFFQSLLFLIRFKPDLVFSFGGYLAVPVVLAAWILRIPSVTHEQTSVTGLANRFISKFVDKIFITWESSRKYFNSNKTILTGLPLRESLLYPKGVIDDFNFKNELPTIYITGGKQGCHSVNNIIEKYLADILSFTNVIHQIGSTTITNDFNILTKAHEKLSPELKNRYIPREYIYENEIGTVFKKADLIISRSGAHTTYELMTLGKPSILIPIAWSSHGEQLANAKKLADMGLAKVLEEKNIKKDILLKEIKYMLKNLNNYKNSRNKIKNHIIFDATEKIVGEILKYEKTNN